RIAGPTPPKAASIWPSLSQEVPATAFLSLVSGVAPASDCQLDPGRGREPARRLGGRGGQPDRRAGQAGAELGSAAGQRALRDLRPSAGPPGRLRGGRRGGAIL